MAWLKKRRKELSAIRGKISNPSEAESITWQIEYTTASGFAQ